MAGYKEYVIDFKIGDGTTHSIPLKIPLGENGGYYTPVIEQISDTEIKVSYTPSMADMPPIEPVAIKIPGSGGNVDLTGYATEEWVREGYQPKGDYMDSSALPTAVNNALAQAKASGEFDGEPGKTPEKSVDYWTEEDKEEVTAEANTLIATELAKRGQLKPEFAESEDWLAENGDQTKLYVLPNGYIYAYMMTEVEVEVEDPNRIPRSTVSGGGSIYNENGYKVGYRLNSSAEEKEAQDGVVFGFIGPVTKNSVVRIRRFSNGYIAGKTNSCNYIHLYDSSYKLLTTAQQGSGTNIVNADTLDERTRTLTITLSSILDDDSVAFMRVSSLACAGGTKATKEDAEAFIITVDQEITDGAGITVTEYAWANTGHAFVTSDKVNGDVNINVESNVIFVNSPEECINPDNLYVVLPDGFIHAYMLVETEAESYKNWIHYSTDSSGSIYNECGYKVGYRLNSTSTEKQLSDCVTFGFIPVTKNSVVRIKNFAQGIPAHTGNYIHLYALIDSDYVLLTKNQEGYTPSVASKGIGTTDENGIYTFTPSEILDDDSIAFMRVSSIATTNGGTATDDDAEKFIITVDQEITDNTTSTTKEYKWINTGHAFIPADYGDKINDIKNIANNNTSRIKALEANVVTGINIPDYWLSHLQEKAHQIQLAMEDAGRNKSAFLWYTDAHWVNGNSKMSPILLNYLYRNTSMNKVNFGGDIIGDSLLETREAMSYLYEWRRMIKDLPNHHSVLGNHDNFRNDNVDYEDDNFVYSFLIAPEESADMVMGGDFYYYIDNPCEKTRYIYLDSGRYSLSDGETAFVIDALKNTPSGWHIVVISHIWFQYSAAATPTVGSMNGSMQKLLNLFDAYNSRGSGSVTMVSTAQSYDFTNCGGKVEFCIGGHIHVDYDITSTGGIPVIITTADANQNRVPDSEVDSGTIGTITESAVFGIIADYNSNKITVVGVGRGTDRVISY